MSINNMKAMYNQKTLKYLRFNCTSEWKQEYFRKANNTCEITGRKGKPSLKLTVHHASESFDSISRRVHKQLGIKYHEFTYEYKPEDLAAVVKGIKEAHKDVIGAVITEDMHKILHSKFSNPTYEDYKQFKKNYKRMLYQRKNSSRRKAA
jgi:hypothetical protein